uniref:C2 domain-containing protein n=1 Tax=Haemonchus contortus TaxID=6289 RepID=A0A7I4Y6U4_HAECO
MLKPLLKRLAHQSLSTTAARRSESLPTTSHPPRIGAGVFFALNGAMEPNTLLVHVEGARGLYLKNHVTLDAYATVVLHGKGSMRSRAITEVVNTDGDCRWDEHCEFKVTDKSTHITVTVQSKTKFGGAEVIGKCEVPIDQAKKVGGHMWFALKKKRDDSKYRGEIQLQFTFTYEKPSLSVSNTSLNKIEKDGMLDKMKRKIKLVGGRHKQAEDTMSVTSGVSSASMTSSRSTRFMSRLNRTISKKLSSLQDGHTIFSQNDTNSSLESNGHLAPPVPNGNAVVYREGKQSNVSRPSSTISGIDFNEDPSYTQSNRLSTPISNGGQFTQNVGGSPTASTAESFHRANSIRSVASSGFGGSNKPAKQRNDDLAYSQQDLLALVDSLRLELRVKDSRLRDMEEYMDNLISRVMERNPELLAAPLAPDKPKRRYF